MRAEDEDGEEDGEGDASSRVPPPPRISSAQTSVTGAPCAPLATTTHSCAVDTRGSSTRCHRSTAPSDPPLAIHRPRPPPSAAALASSDSNHDTAVTGASCALPTVRRTRAAAGS